MNIKRVLRWYQKNPGDELVGEAEMQEVSLTDLQKLFEIQLDDPMYECYPVTQKHIEYLRQHIDAEIDITKHDYFVECDAVT